MTSGPAGCDHLDSIIEPFTLSDLPLVLWYPVDAPRGVGLPAARRRRRRRRQPGDGRLETLAGTGRPGPPPDRRRPVVGAAGSRGGSCSPASSTARSTGPSPARSHPIEVHGKPGPRQLLAGWLLVPAGRTRGRRSPRRRPPRRPSGCTRPPRGPPRHVRGGAERRASASSGPRRCRRRPESRGGPGPARRLAGLVAQPGPHPPPARTGPGSRHSSHAGCRPRGPLPSP